MKNEIDWTMLLSYKKNVENWVWEFRLKNGLNESLRKVCDARISICELVKSQGDPMIKNGFLRHPPLLEIDVKLEIN